MKKLHYVLGTIIFTLLLLSITSAYYKFIVVEDYVVESQVECDPTTERCFVWNCDPAIEGECTGNPEEDTFYYKLAHRNVQNISCDEENACDFSCRAGEQNCGEILCSEDNPEEIECYTELTVNPE